MHARDRSSDPGRVDNTMRAAHGLTLPFLPTLVTALALGGLGLLCRPPAEPVPAAAHGAAQPVDAARVSEPVSPGQIESASASPATLSGLEAFGRQYPLSVARTAGLGVGRTARGGATSLGRCVPPGCNPSRTLSTPVRPTEASARVSPIPPIAEREPDLPTDALPFAPTAVALLDCVRSISGRVVDVGSSMTSALTPMR